MNKLTDTHLSVSSKLTLLLLSLLCCTAKTLGGPSFYGDGVVELLSLVGSADTSVTYGMEYVSDTDPETEGDQPGWIFNTDGVKPYAGIDAETLSMVDATMHAGYVNLGVVARVDGENFAVTNSGSTGTVDLFLGEAILADGSLGSPALSPTGVWSFVNGDGVTFDIDGNPTNPSVVGAGFMTVTVKNATLPAGGKLNLFYADLVIAGNVDISAINPDDLNIFFDPTPGKGAIRVLEGGQLTLTVEQVDILQNIPIDIVGSGTVITLQAKNATQVAKFDDPTASSFASDVAVSGSLALVAGASGTGNEEIGGIYSYQKIADEWVFDEQFFAPDGEDFDPFSSVAMSGDVAIIGAPRDDDPTNGEDSGSAFLFRHNGADWVFEQKITASDAASNRQFGGAVAISGTVAAVGIPAQTGAPGGTVYVFRYNGATWLEEKILTASDAADGDNFGTAVAVSDDLVVVGALAKSGGGAAYIYRNTVGTTWVEEKILTASDGVDDDKFGSAVAVSGSLAIIGAPNVNGQQGAAYLYRNTGGAAWDETRIPRENPPPVGTAGSFGDSVAISGEVALVGAWAAEGNRGTGHLFHFDGSEWIETVIVPEDPSTNFGFGNAVALSGNSAILGAAFDSDFGNNGAAFLYNIAVAIRSVTIGGQTTGEIELSGEVDGFRVSLQANTTYKISILGNESNNGTLLDPNLLGIFTSSDLSGTPIRSVQTLKTQFVGDDSTSFFTPQSAGEYFIAVQSSDGGIGTYTVAVEDIGVRDDYSADVGTTGSIVAGSSAIGRIDFSQDNDWFEVTLPANRLYEIKLIPLAGGNALADPFFHGVYDSSGVLIKNTENDDGGDGTSSALQFVTDDAGTFYLAAGGFGDTTGQYYLELNDLGVLDDDTFDITIEFTSDDTPNNYIAAFEDAVERWKEIITGDLPYAFVEGYGFVDDILIEVAVENIELVFEGVEQSILALSTVLDQRSDASAGAGALPTYSRIVVNSEEVGQLLNLDEFVMHTIGRALGFGALWEEFGIVRDIDGIATYTGPNALREMQALSRDLNGVNVLEDGKNGSLAAEYWSESVLDNELMTPRIEMRRPEAGPGTPGIPDNPISALTIAAMQDLGYQVNYDAADRYFLASGALANVLQTFSYDPQPSSVFSAGTPTITENLIPTDTTATAMISNSFNTNGIDENLFNFELSRVDTTATSAGLASSDFNSDGQADMLRHNETSGAAVAWLMNGTQAESFPTLGTAPIGDWHLVGTGDFNSDGQADMLCQDHSRGEVVIWFMDGTTVAGYDRIALLSDLSWHVVGSADIDGDGSGDIVWRNQSDGHLVIWLMEGSANVGFIDLGAITDQNWKIVGTDDFDGNGEADLLWQNRSTGEVALWFMAGGGATDFAGVTTLADLDWEISGTGDFDNDGRADIIWRNQSTGNTVIWLMDRDHPVDFVDLGFVDDTVWQIRNR